MTHSMRTHCQFSNRHLVLSGHELEMYEYENPIAYGFTTKRVLTGQSVERTEEERAENRGRSMGRARKTIRRLVHANFDAWVDQQGKPYISKFLILTFRELTFDVKTANDCFTLFIKRLNYFVFASKRAIIQYLAVIEFQPTSGKVHYHVVLFNLPFIDRYYDVFNDVWGNGYIHIEKITSGKNAAQYITKYMTKENDDRLRGEKSYFCSRGLKKPIVINEEEFIWRVSSHIRGEPTYRREFVNEHTGKSIYSCFDISGHRELKHFIESNGSKPLS